MIDGSFGTGPSCAVRIVNNGRKRFPPARARCSAASVRKSSPSDSSLTNNSSTSESPPRTTAASCSSPRSMPATTVLDAVASAAVFSVLTMSVPIPVVSDGSVPTVVNLAVRTRDGLATVAIASLGRCECVRRRAVPRRRFASDRNRHCGHRRRSRGFFGRGMGRPQRPRRRAGGRCRVPARQDLW